MTRKTLTAALLGMALPASAHAATSSVVAPPSPSHDAFSLSADLSNQGGAVVGWTDDGGGEHAMVAVRTRFGARFSTPRSVGRGRTLRVGVAPDGTGATVLWSSRGRLRAASRTAQGRWVAQALPSMPASASQTVLSLAVASQGRATALVEERSGGTWRLLILRRTGGRWAMGAPLQASDVGGGHASAGRDGTVVAAWLAEGDDGGVRLMVARQEAAGDRWSTAEGIATSTSEAALTQPFTDLAADGTAMVLAGRQTPTGASGLATVAWQRPGGAWTPMQIEAQAAAGLSPAGRLWVANASTSVVQVRTVDAQNAWVTPESVGKVSPGSVSAGPGLQSAWDTVGAWWVVGGKGRPDRWVLSLRGAAGWTRPRTVASTSGVVSFAGSPGGLTVVFVDTARKGRIVAVDLDKPR